MLLLQKSSPKAPSHLNALSALAGGVYNINK